MLNPNTQLKKILIILLTIIVFGSVSYSLLGHSFPDAVYITIIVMLSHFIHGLEDNSYEKVLEILLILSSYFILAYVIKSAAEYMFSGTFIENRRKRKMTKKIDSMKNHYILCGYGRVGKQIAHELSIEKVNFVVIDRKKEVVRQAIEDGYIAIEGNPVDEETLLKSNIKKAKSLIAALGVDSDNIFLVLTAKSLSPSLYIVARSSNEENVQKLEKAGANKVTLPYRIGGYHMAAEALRPAVIDLLDIIVDGDRSEIQVEQLMIGKKSKLANKEICKVINKKSGIVTLAINKNNGNTKINPSKNELLEDGDQLILMGAKDQLNDFMKKTFSR